VIGCVGSDSGDDQGAELPDSRTCSSLDVRGERGDVA
jgi:hypothetical protein